MLRKNPNESEDKYISLSLFFSHAHTDTHIHTQTHTKIHRSWGFPRLWKFLTRLCSSVSKKWASHKCREQSYYPTDHLSLGNCFIEKFLPVQFFKDFTV